jgi:hypothetical protein
MNPPSSPDPKRGPCTPISRARFLELVGPAAGLPVSSTWRGHGSAAFLELGELRHDPGDDPAYSHARGEITVMIQWSWRVEGPRSIRFGSDSPDRRLTNGIRRLAGDRVVSLDVEGRLPELVVTLASGRVLRSFMTAEGQPAWCVFLPDGGWIAVERGRLVHDTRDVEPRP